MGDCQNTPVFREMLLVLQCSACLGQRRPGSCLESLWTSSCNSTSASFLKSNPSVLCTCLEDRMCLSAVPYGAVVVCLGLFSICSETGRLHYLHSISLSF